MLRGREYAWIPSTLLRMPSPSITWPNKDSYCCVKEGKHLVQMVKVGFNISGVHHDIIDMNEAALANNNSVHEPLKSNCSIL